MRDVAIGRGGMSIGGSATGPGNGSLSKPRSAQHRTEDSEHILAAWSYISEQENAAKYDDVAVEIIKDRIRSAARNQGVELSD